MRTTILLLMIFLATPLWAASLLTPVDDRISDQAIERDLQIFHAVQDRVDLLNRKGQELDRYHITKAQAWLDFAWDEYHENDRGSVVDEALNHSLFLIAKLEEQSGEISMDTPSITGEKRVREDLWQKAEEFKKHEHFHCAQEPIAMFEVRLVWAGHEDSELGWRHARDHIQLAEQWARLAAAKLANCTLPEPAPTPAPAPVAEPACPPAVCFQPYLSPPPAAPFPPQTDIPDFRTVVYFDLDKNNLQATGPGTLDAALTFIREHPEANRIRIEAHTDRLNTAEYNQKLSDRRAQTVRDYFVAHGIAAERIGFSGYGEERPVVFCDDADYPRKDALAACLQKNRRAEILLYMPK